MNRKIYIKSRYMRYSLVLLLCLGVVSLGGLYLYTHNFNSPRKSNPMKFNDIARVFGHLESVSSRTEMTKILAELLQHVSPHEASIVCNISLGQLNPPYIGTQFNLAEKTMIKVIADLLQQDPKTVQEHAKQVGDLGLIVEKGQWKPTHDLTLQNVYDVLTEIEDMQGTGSQEEKSAALKNLLMALEPEGAKFVVRIILGKLRLGFSDMTIVDALSWMETGDKSLRDTIENAYNMCADIGLIAAVLKEKGIEAVKKMKIHIGIPIRPAAAERLPTARAIMEKIGPSIAQPKLDGFRVQIHLDKSGKEPQIHFFSRNLQDMSAMFPDVKDAVAHLNVTSLICEGEAIVYDNHTGSFLPFQETVKRKRKHDIEQTMAELPLKVFIFDILYLDGVELMSKTHEERRHILMLLFNHNPSDVIQPIDELHVQTATELEHYFAQNIAAGLEGLVVKKPDSIYQPGKRNFNWIKLKRQEEGHLEDTLDCVVLGYYAGQGKRAGFGIGAFLVGVYNKKQDRFETIAKVGTGLKDPDWIEIKKRCDALKVLGQPKNVVCAKELVPDVWVAPELVVRIRADEITMSPVHTAGKTQDHLGYALRFPRFMDYAIDKSAGDATTIVEVEHLYNDQFAGS